MAKIVLCSASPRRQELLRHIGITDFDIRIPEADESVPAGLTAQETVEYISRQKALAGRKLCAEDEICITADTMVFLDHVRLGKPADEADESVPAGLTAQETVEYISRQKALAGRKLCAEDEICITADTMVFLDHVRLGKPADEADALRMLTALQGRGHTVCTGVTVCRGDEMLTECETTEVRFRAAEERELLSYIRTGEPMDKAGAYGIQGLGCLLVEGIHGDYYNVMGLPVLRLSRMLEKFGVTLL